MDKRQEKRAHGDLRHWARNKRLQKLLAAKSKKKAIPEAAGANALVVGVTAGICSVIQGEDALNVRCDMPAVPGDRVELRAGKVAGIAPRRSILARTDPANPFRERIIAANLDLLIIVASIDSPPFRPGLVDRYIIAAHRGGIRPILCINKIDLRDDTSIAEVHRIPVVRCSTVTGEGIAEFNDLLAGNVAVLAGHSGVGKSSLLNALAGECAAHTGGVNQETGKGRHTTTGSRLYRLRNGGRIIDTPGIREFGLGPVTLGELREAFPEFATQACRFRDCTHREEPECAVRGTGGARYSSYLRLAMEL